MRECGIIIGRDNKGNLKRLLGDQHCILHAMSGSGKTQGFSLPNAMAWKGSFIGLDIKREMFTATAGWRAQRGQEVYLFDPAAEDGRSHRWNPFWQVDRDSNDRFADISRMGYQLWPEVTGDQAFWVNAARQTWWGIANLIAETSGEALTMANVLRVFQRGGKEWLVRLIQDRRRPGIKPYSQTVVDVVADYLSHEDRLGDSIRTEVTVGLQVFSNPRVAAATSATDFDLAEVRRRPMSVFVGVSPGDMHHMAPLMRLFFESLLTVNSGKTPAQSPQLVVPVLLLLDEFTQLKRMKSLTDALQYMRGYGFRIALVVQNRAAIMDTYGSYGASDVFDNMGLEMVFGTNDHVLADQLERRLGDYTVRIVTKNRPRWAAWLSPARQSEAEHPHRRPLMLRQEILALDSSKFIALRPGMAPAILNKIRAWQEPELIAFRLPPPTIPQLTVHIPLDDGASVINQGRQESPRRSLAPANAP
jgi:type IV secretion system protein VirD4